jgi:CheY-like chemotaxis protein
MARIRLIHWNGPEGRECKLRLASLGYEAEFNEGPGFLKLMRSIRSNPPDAFVIDLSRLPSHGREFAMSIRTSKATRAVPIVFVDGDPEKVARVRTLLPDASYTSWDRLKTALPRAIANAPKTPIVPPSHIYTGRPTVEKLGIKEGMRVAVIGAPPGFADTLKPLPARVKLSAKPDAATDLFICVVRAQRELGAHLVTLSRAVGRQTLWMVWPKKASGVKSDVNGNIIRETGLASGWVDFKVCSLDDTWSGLAFKRRK